MEVKEKNSKIEYIAMYLLIAVSGMPFFYLGPWGTIGSLVFVLFLMFFLDARGSIKVKPNVKSFAWIAGLLIMTSTILQTVQVGVFPLIVFNKFITRCFFAFIVLCVVQQKIFKLYINVIFVLGIISLSIHILTFLIPPFFDFLIDKVVPLVPNQFTDENVLVWHNYNIIIHDFWQRDLFRNSGPFWEPGANAGFNLLAMFFNMFIYQKKLSDRKNIFFLIVVLSTLSTTGYFGLMVVLFLNPQFNQRAGLKIFSIVVLLFLAFYVIQNVDFVGKKIITQLDNINTGTAHESRFASARLDLITFQDHPFGFSPVDFRGGKREDEDFRTNGVFILLSNYGIILFVLYYVFTFRGFNKAIKLMNPTTNANLGAFYFVLFITIIGLSENYFERPLFMAFALVYPFFKTRPRYESFAYLATESS